MLLCVVCRSVFSVAYNLSSHHPFALDGFLWSGGGEGAAWKTLRFCARHHTLFENCCTPCRDRHLHLNRHPTAAYAFLPFYFRKKEEHCFSFWHFICPAAFALALCPLCPSAIQCSFLSTAHLASSYLYLFFLISLPLL